DRDATKLCRAHHTGRHLPTQRLLIEGSLPRDDQIRLQELVVEPDRLHHRVGPGSQGGTAEREQSEPQTAGRPRTRLVLQIETEISIRDGGEMPERVIEVPDVLGGCALL